MFSNDRRAWMFRIAFMVLVFVIIVIATSH